MSGPVDRSPWTLEKFLWVLGSTNQKCLKRDRLWKHQLPSNTSNFHFEPGNSKMHASSTIAHPLWGLVFFKWEFLRPFIGFSNYSSWKSLLTFSASREMKLKLVFNFGFSFKSRAKCLPKSTTKPSKTTWTSSPPVCFSSLEVAWLRE